MYIKHAMQHPTYVKQSDAARQAFTDKLAQLEAQAKSFSDNTEQLPEDVEVVRLRLEKDLVQRPEKAFIDRLPADILLEIARHGQAMDEDLPAKMGRVCRRWRSLVLHTPCMWSTLRLRRNKAVKKTQVYLERSNGNITSLVIAEEPIDGLEVVTNVLQSSMSMPRLRSCRIDIPCDHRDLHGLLRSARSLRHLEAVVPGGVAFPLLADLPELQTLKLFFQDGIVAGYHFGREHLWPALTMVKVHWHELRPEVGFWSFAPMMLRCISQARDVDLKRTETLPFTGSWSDGDPTAETIIMQAVRFSVNGLFHRWRDGDGCEIRLPQVEHLDLRHNSPWFCRTMLSEYVPAATLSNLTYLDISHVGGLRGEQGCFPLSMIDTLRKMVALRYLNVSYTDLTDSFLEALMPATDKDAFALPDLVALSAAGNSQLTAAPIRDLVMSRVDPDAWPAMSRAGLVKKAAASIAAGAFRPCTTGAPMQRGQGAPATGRTKRKADSLDDLIGLSGSRHRSRIVALTSSPSTSYRKTPVPRSVENAKDQSPMPSTGKQPTELAQPRKDVVPPVRQKPQRIQWLCLDHCEGIEATLADILSPHMRFVSLQYGSFVEDRVQGLRNYKWDAE